jgi:orotate phosphoribosyltransferase
VDDVSGHTPPTQLEIVKTTGYSRTLLYANDIPRGSNVILVEPISSTGGTLRSVAEVLEANGVNVIDMVSVIGKPDYRYEEEVARSGKRMKTLLKVGIKNYMESEGRGFSDTEIEKTEWFRKAEPIVDRLYPLYEESMKGLLRQFPKS